jgi:hypothetical protein
MTTTVDQIVETTKKLEGDVQAVSVPLQDMAMFIPVYGFRLALAIKLALGAVAIILEAVAALMKANGGDLMLAWAQWVAHNNPRMTNSSVLSGNKDTPPVIQPKEEAA